MTHEPTDAAAAVSGDETLLRLKFVVFICGAVLMSLEMAGVRVLNVYFGSTIYVWGAIIGIFLGALSLGYFVGGIVADRWPRFPVLGTVILFAAVFTAIVPGLSRPFCEWLGAFDDMDPRWQAFLSSIALYFIPSVALGMVSPFAVRLAARRLGDIGRVSGRLYALSTFGSITGTFLTSFVLVEHMGTHNVILALAATLLVTGLLCMPGQRRAQVAAAMAALLLSYPAYAGARLAVGMEDPRFTNVLLATDSAYHTIRVAEGTSWVNDPEHYGLRSRFLLFNQQAQSGMELEGPGRDKQVVTACGYTDMLHLGMVFRDAAPKRMLVLGCGGGVGASVFHQDYPGIERIDVVDIDPVVFELARKYFRFPDKGASEVIRAHVRDGRLFVRGRPDGHYDYIILDAYSSGGRVPFHLVTQEFFHAVEGILAPGGVVVANVISGVDGRDGRLFRSIYRTLDSVFPQVYGFPRRFREGASNIMLVATRGAERLNRTQLETRYRERKERLIQRDTLAEYILHLVPDPPYGKDDPILTDDYCPTDSMIVR